MRRQPRCDHGYVVELRICPVCFEPDRPVTVWSDAGAGSFELVVTGDQSVGEEFAELRARRRQESAA